MATSNSQRLARWFFAVVHTIVLTIVLAPAAARADPSDEAKAHVAKATQAHKERRYDDARVELEAAYALAPKPELLYALGQVHAKLGRCAEAAAYYHRFAASQRDPQVPKLVEQAIAACTPAAPPAAPPAPEPAARSEPRPWYHDKLGDGLVIGGVVLGVLGILEYGAARSDLDAAEDHASTTTLARYHQLVDDAHGERMTAIVLVGSGSLLIAAGIARFVLHDRGRSTEVRVGAAPVRGGGLVTYQGSF